MSEYELGTALDTDYYGVFENVPAEDRAVWQRARDFIIEILPEVNDAWDKAEYPLRWATRLGELDLLNDGVEGPGLNTISPLAAGLATMELSRGDGSIGTIVGVQAGLALRSVAMYGSDEQKAEWLVPLSRGEKLGAFALTEPDHGSDSVSLETTAVRDGDEWVINGSKKWIGNGSVGHMSVCGRAMRPVTYAGLSFHRTPPVTRRRRSRARFRYAPSTRPKSRSPTCGSPQMRYSPGQTASRTPQRSCSRRDSGCLGRAWARNRDV